MIKFIPFIIAFSLVSIDYIPTKQIKVAARFNTVTDWITENSPVDLPIAFVDTSYTLPSPCDEIDVGVTPTGGCKIITVDSGQNFQTALNDARRGDIIRLAGDSAFTGPFTLPNKADGSGWVYIISSGHANLPVFGNRVIPDDMGGTCGNEDGLYCGATPNVTMAADIATIQGGGSPHIAIQTASGADRYRFIGVEIKPAAGQFASSLIRIFEDSEYIIFDRIISRGDPSVHGRRSLQLQGDNTAVIGSYISRWLETGSDSQAITWQDGADFSAVINNYLEAASENLFPDTTTNTIADQPHDIEIRHNLIRKANNWRATCGSDNVKNLFEIKAGHRILVEYNEFADSWATTSAGSSDRCGQEAGLNVKQGIEVTNKHTTHITFRYNRMVRVGNATKWCMAHCNGTNDSVGHDFAIYGNVFEVDGNTYGQNTTLDGGGLFHFFASTGANLIADHNTFINNGKGIGAISTDNANGGVLTNNIVTNLTEFLTGDADAMWNDYTYTNNLIIGGTCANHPSGNNCPVAYSNVGFVNFNGGVGGDYTLDVSSIYKGIGNDVYGVGTNDPGANISKLNNFISCVMSGACAAIMVPMPSPIFTSLDKVMFRLGLKNAF